MSAVAETYYSTLIEDLARPAVKESYPLVGGQRSYKKYAAVCLEAQQVHSLMMMMALFCLSERTPLLTHFFLAHSSRGTFPPPPSRSAIQNASSGLTRLCGCSPPKQRANVENYPRMYEIRSSGRSYEIFHSRLCHPDKPYKQLTVYQFPTPGTPAELDVAREESELCSMIPLIGLSACTML